MSEVNYSALRAQLNAHAELNDTDLELIFKERAALLAQVPAEQAGSVGSEVFIFSLGRLRFAVEMHMVASVFVPRTRSEIPGAPAHLSEVTYVGGRIVSLLRLDVLMSSRGDSGDAGKCILLEHEGKRIALVADQLLGISELDLKTLSPAAQAVGSDLLIGVGNDMTLVLDGARVVESLRVDSSHSE